MEKVDVVSGKLPLVEHEKSVTILNLASCCPRWGSEQIDEHRTSLLDQSLKVNHDQALLIDMSQVTFFGSAFIELLLQIWNNIKQKSGAKMAICCASNYCMDIITITRLDSIWTIYPSRQSAIEGLTSKA